MGGTLSSFRRTFRRNFQLPVSEFLVQVPRLVARGVYFILPLYLSYGSKVVTISGQPTHVAAYPYYWPIWILLFAYGVAAIYKLSNRASAAVVQQRILDSAAGGSLRQLQAYLLSCPDRDSLDSIQIGILSVIVDKTKSLTLERRDGIISANIMIADEIKKQLRLTMFSRYSTGRRKIDISFDAPGAGRAIKEMKPIYLPDIRAAGLTSSFRDDAPYRSILSIPIACEHQKIGVVNVDSAEPYAFSHDLVEHLQPYVQMIGLSLCVGGDAHGQDRDSESNTA